MTKEEFQEIMRALGLAGECESTNVYVFYRTDDGMVHNFSLGVRAGRTMSDEEVVGMMRREYPSTRVGEVLTVERPQEGEHHRRARPEWLDVTEVCRMLNINDRTLRRWTRKGVFNSYMVNGKLFYEKGDIDRAIAENIIQENGRLDTACLMDLDSDNSGQ